MIQVAPAESEHMILEHPHVVDAAVIGIPHDIWGQVPRAFVVKREEYSLTQEEVAHFLNGIKMRFFFKFVQLVLVYLIDLNRKSFQVQTLARRGPIRRCHSQDCNRKNLTERTRQASVIIFLVNSIRRQKKLSA